MNEIHIVRKRTKISNSIFIALIAIIITNNNVKSRMPNNILKILKFYERKLYKQGFDFWNKRFNKELYPIMEDIEIKNPSIINNNNIIIHTTWTYNNNNNYRSLLDFKDKEFVPLILVHGYGAANGYFFSVLPGIAHTYKKGPVISIDLPGSGMSSRPEWTDVFLKGRDDALEVEKFYVQSIEYLRNKIGAKKIILLGHSLGGYLISNYTIHYPQNVSRLILSSTPAIEHQIISHPFFRWENMGDNIKRYVIKSWEKISPFSIVRFGLYKGIGYKLLKLHLNRSLDSNAICLNKRLFINYIYNNWWLGNVSIGGKLHCKLLHPTVGNQRTLKDRLLKINIPCISFIYGKRDWVSPSHACLLHKNIIKRNEIISNVYILKNSNHQIVVNNCCDFVNIITRILDNKDKNDIVKL